MFGGECFDGSKVCYSTSQCIRLENEEKERGWARREEGKEAGKGLSGVLAPHLDCCACCRQVTAGHRPCWRHQVAMFNDLYRYNLKKDTWTLVTSPRRYGLRSCQHV